jgi:hypothetical protein
MASEIVCMPEVDLWGGRIKVRILVDHLQDPSKTGTDIWK